MKNKITLWNVLTNFILQICLIANGFIIPKIILSYFGSEVNGLISSINQFLSYITLVEGGVTGVITAALYKPLVNRDMKKLSSIVNTSAGFYRKVGYIFIAYSIVIAIFYPLIFKSSFSYFYILSLTLILSISLIIQYMFSLTLKTFLTADKKLYIISITQIVVIILTIAMSFLSVRIYPSIHFLKIVSGILFLLQPIVYSHFINKNYALDKYATVDYKLLSNRWNGFAVNVAFFIHASTDITLLTIFSSLEMVSVYSVYALVATGIRSIINAICGGINPTIGQAYASKNQQDLKMKFDVYEYITFILVFVIFSVAFLLITPFVLLYTKGITDVSYNQPVFGYLLLVAEAIYLLKNPHVNLSYSADKFKEITIPAFVEAGLNIVVSLLLVAKLGLIGVAIGSIVGMLYRTIFHVQYTKKLISEYKPIQFYSKCFIFTLVLILFIAICKYTLPDLQDNMSSWLVNGMMYLTIISILYFIISIIFYRKEIYYLKKYVKK